MVASRSTLLEEVVKEKQSGAAVERGKHPDNPDEVFPAQRSFVVDYLIWLYFIECKSVMS